MTNSGYTSPLKWPHPPCRPHQRGSIKEDLSLNLDRINQGMHQFSRFEKWPPPTLARDARPPNNEFCNNYSVISTRQCLFSHTRPPALSMTCKPAQRNNGHPIALCMYISIRIL